MTSQEKDVLGLAADFLEQDNKNIADALRHLADKETTGMCARCDEPLGRAHHHLFGTFKAFKISMDITCPPDALLCESCIRTYLDKLPSKELKS